MENNQLVVLKMDQYGLQESKAKDIKNLYLPMINKLEELEDEFNIIVSQDINDETAKRAKDLLKITSKIRISADNKRIEAKAEFLRANKAIQGAYNTLEYVVKSKEETLRNIVKFKERQEQERQDKIKDERVDQLAEYGMTDIEDLMLGSMAQKNFDIILKGAKSDKEADEAADKEAAKLKEKEAIFTGRKEQLLPLSSFCIIPDLTIESSENEFKLMLSSAKDKKKKYDEKQKKLKAENDKLKKEADRKDKIHEERSKIMSGLWAHIPGQYASVSLNYAALSDTHFEEMVAAGSKAKDVAEKADKDAKDKADKRQELINARFVEMRPLLRFTPAMTADEVGDMPNKEYAAMILKSRKSMEKANKESKERDEAEKKRIAKEASDKKAAKEKEEQERLAALAPDKDKIKAYLDKVGEIEAPEITDPIAKEVLADIFKKKANYIKWSLKEIEKIQ